MRSECYGAIVLLLGALLLAAGTAACGFRRGVDRSLAGAVALRGNDAAECGDCHEDVARRYATSAHAARHILCGQCHGGGDHPEPAAPVTDGTCAGCHTSQFREQLASAHFAARVPVDLVEWLGRDGAEDAAAPQFFVRSGDLLRFIGQRDTGGAGGLLCVGCHFEEHGFGLVSVRRAEGCRTCHAGREDHYADVETEAADNRCLGCHVFAGMTVNGQVVNSHRFEK